MTSRPIDPVAAAVAFAAEAHAGQVYYGNNLRLDQPYILHPLRVMAQLVERGYASEPYLVVGLLHDCMEDVGRQPAWLNEDERGALALLTRNGEDYALYIQSIAAAVGAPGRIAREVKRCDLLDNLAHDPADRLRKRYVAAFRVLTLDIEEEE